jgi:hypothetical protein
MMQWSLNRVNGFLTGSIPVERSPLTSAPRSSSSFQKPVTKGAPERSEGNAPGLIVLLGLK